MSQQQPQRPVTYGDVFPVSGTLASQPITKEDAALMQRTEAVTHGHTLKDGAAATMQSAADYNVQASASPEDAQTSVANEGVNYGDVLSVASSLPEMQPVSKEDAALMQRLETLSLGHTQKGGIAASMQSVANKNVQARAGPGDAEGSGVGDKCVTYGDVLSVVGTPASKPVTKEDAANMQRAEIRTLGHTEKGGISAKMQSAADKNLEAGAIHSNNVSYVAPDKGLTHGDVLSEMGMKPITKEDAAIMQRAEALARGHIQKGGIAATMQSAAVKNEQGHTIPEEILGSVSNEGVTHGEVLSFTGTLATEPVTKEDASLMQSAEMRVLGHTQRGGTAAMQSTTDQSVQARVIPNGADSSVATQGIMFGDVFPVEGELAAQPITKEDAALMQRAETLAFGHTQKGGAASAMQSAADYNVQAGAVPKDAHSSVAEEAGVTVVTTILPKETVHTQFVIAGQPIPSSGLPTRSVHMIATNSQDTVTIGEALEAAAMRAGDEPIEASDARAIQSAERRAAQGSPIQPGGLAATAQAAAVLNPRVEDFAKTTLSDVLMDASVKLPHDKVVTWEDAAKVAEAELRNKSTSEIRDCGVAAALVTAAELNDKASLAPPSSQMEQQLKLE